MQRKSVAVLVGVVVVAGVLASWFGIRHHGHHAAKKPIAAENDPWARPRTDRPKGDTHADQGRRDGAMPRLAHEVDPVGTFSLDGQVLDEDDQPVAGAIVRISSAPPRTATTNATGEFSFDKLLGRTYSLTARHDDKVGGPVQAKGSSKDPVVIRLRPGAALEVAVTDAATRKPVAAARVLLVDEEGREETTGPDGVARFAAIDDGWVRIAVIATGYSPGDAATRVDRGAKKAHLDVALQRGAALSGRVVDEQHQPVADARIWAVDAASAWSSGAGDRNAVTSAKDGSFTIPALAAGSWILFAKDETHAPATSKPITVSGELPTTGVEIVMPAAATIAGVVVDGKQAPVPYATVTLSSDRWSIDMVYRQAAADEQGRFSIRALPRRTFKVRATSDEAASDPVAVDLTGVAEKNDVRLVLDRNGTISGIVVDSNNDGVAEADVSAGPDFLSGDHDDADFLLGSGDTATTDGDGRFVLHGLADGTYRLFAVRDSGGERRTADRAGVTAKVGATNVRLVLPSPGGIEGKVLLESGEAPSHATITAGWSNRTSTADGDFHLTDVQPATYDVRISGTDFSEVVKRDVVVAAGKVVDLGTITVRPGRKVAGKVVDASGAAVEGAKVVMGQLLFGDGKRLGTGDDGEDQPGVRQAISNAQGEFVIVGASRSGGSVIADHADRGRSVAVVIPAGKDDVRGVTLTLAGFGSVAGKVTRKGEPVVGATVSAAPSGASGQAVFVSAGADGSFVFDKLPAGSTTLMALDTGMMKAASGSRTVTVVEGKQIDGSVDLPAGDITVTVHCKPKEGQQVDGAQIFLFHGAVSPRTGLDVSNLFLARRGVPPDLAADQSDVGVAAGMSFWLGVGDPKFDDVLPGVYSLCAIPFTGQITNQQLMERLMRNLDKVAAVCMPLTIAPAPTALDVTFELPGMAPLPDDAE
ncbi:MAG TPA: carboxypeptidase-like regulatory domain-containing protein [Kofleriaceae bacterium]|nr:carboxypeptidase-like regulatory domain-containing protein [Kofleriaceae bacterium]